MTQHFDDVISLGRPTEIQDAGAVGGVMNFTTIHGNLSLSRRNTPYNGHVMLFSTTIRSSQSVAESLLVRKSKAPIDGVGR